MNDILNAYTMNLSYDLSWLARKETALTDMPVAGHC